MKWIKVKIDYYSENLEMTKNFLVSMFEEIGIKEIELVDYFSDSSLDYNINFKKENDIWSITGYIMDNRFAMIKLDIIHNNLIKFSENNEELAYEIYTSNCSDDEWQDEWKKYFHMVNITENIIIKPSWDEYRHEDNKTVIEIDPGMAFGTGTHETTALCAEFIEKYGKDKKELLDIGCGSGILMLIGKKLGIGNVTGIDIDEKVEEVVIKNFEKNNINENYKVIIGNLIDDINEKYDLIVSNILVDVLTKLLDSIEKILKEGTIVIFSGILSEKEEVFVERAKKINLLQIDRNEKNGWVSVVFEYKKIL